MPYRILKRLYSYVPIAIILLGILFTNFNRPLLTFIVQEKIITSKMYFPGIATPINMKYVVSPVRGIITKVSANYGERVKEGQELFTIQSSEMATNVRKIIENYVRAKSAYQRTLFEANGEAELYRLGLVSKIEFLSKQDQLQSNKLELWDAELELRKILENTSTPFAPLWKKIQILSMNKIEKIQEILQEPLAEIRLKALEKGVLLFPSKSLGVKINEKENTSKISVGNSVEEGQVLGVIANTSGLFFEINVNETNFHDVKLGQKATITGNAFPSLELTGTVVSINHQANSSETGAPTYGVRVKVPSLTEKEQQTIQVGMSAEVALVQKSHPSIEVPITAVFIKNGQYWVKVVNPKDQSIKEVTVKIGDIGVDSVQITNGLKPGESIVLPN